LIEAAVLRWFVADVGKLKRRASYDWPELRDRR
jgi:hypothetical protein